MCAQVVAPLFSIDAKGNINRLITYTSAYGRKIVKKTPVSPLPASADQLGIRQVYNQGCLAWGELPVEEKEEYRERVKGEPLTGFNLFMSEYLTENIPIVGWAKYGAGKYGVNRYGAIS